MVMVTSAPDWAKVIVIALCTYLAADISTKNTAEVFFTLLVLKIMEVLSKLMIIILKLTHSERVDTSPTSEVPTGKISRFWTEDMNPTPLKIDL
jgi:hypothetical protein